MKRVYKWTILHIPKAIQIMAINFAEFVDYSWAFLLFINPRCANGFLKYDH